MITFKELRRRLSESTCEPVDIYDLFEEWLYNLFEGGTFYIYRTDTNAVLERGIPDYDSAKERANRIRKSLNLKWDQVKFRMERQPATQFGVSRDGKTYTNSYGQTGRVDYSRRVNPSKGRRFKGYYDSSGGFHDID